MNNLTAPVENRAWKKGKLVGQKVPFKLEEILGIRVRLEIADNIRELALFNLAIDSKLRTRDLVNLKVLDVSDGSKVQSGVLGTFRPHVTNLL